MTYSWMMAPHKYEPDYEAYIADLDSLQENMANVAIYQDWLIDLLA